VVRLVPSPPSSQVESSFVYHRSEVKVINLPKMGGRGREVLTSSGGCGREVVTTSGGCERGRGSF